MNEYPLEAGHVAVRPDAAEPTTLLRLQSLIDDDDYPLLCDRMCQVELPDTLVQLFLVRGMVPAHVDPVPAEFGECRTLGLVIEDSLGSILIGDDGQPGLPLSPGCVFRLDPRREHGTVHALGEEERDGEHGVFAFVAADYAVGDEPDPAAFVRQVAQVLCDRLETRSDS